MTPEEAGRLLVACKESKNVDLSDIVEVALFTSLRQPEVLELTWDRVDRARGVILFQVQRERFGVRFERVQPTLRDSWDRDAEGDLLGAMAIRGVEPKAVHGLYDWMVDTYNGAVGKVENVKPAEVEQEFRERATKAGLPRELIDNIVRAERERLGLG